MLPPSKAKNKHCKFWLSVRLPKSFPFLGDSLRLPWDQGLPFSAMYTVGHKNVPPSLCPYLRQLLTNFQNSSTGTLCRQFAIM